MAKSNQTTTRAAKKAPAAPRRRKRRRGNRTLHYALMIFFLLAAGVALSLTVFFKIESVTVIGTDKYPPEEIAAASGILPGDNMFRVNAGTVKTVLVEKYPYIDFVELRRKLPHAIQLEITQCKPAGALALDGEYMLITKEGKVLERGLIFIPEEIPLIKGVEAGDKMPGERLGLDESDARKMQSRLKTIYQALAPAEDGEEKSLVEIAALEAEKNELERVLKSAQSAESAMVMLDYLFEAMNETGFQNLTNVDLSDEYNMKIVYENRLLFKLGTEAQLTDKLNFIKQIIEKDLPQDAQGIVDVSDTTKNRLIYEEMTIEEAIAGGKRRERPQKSSSELEPVDSPEPDTNTDEPS